MQASYQLSLPFSSDAGHGDETAVAIDTQFDVALANMIAEFESYNKHLYHPNTYLHKWWARRCGSTFRLILKHLVENEHQRDYYAPGGLEGKIILDPMMGGGTTLHEAIRLGANVIGADIDPIPVLQARATLSDIPLSDLEAAFDGFYHELCVELGPFFVTVTACPTCGQTTEMRLTLYGLRRTCECGPALFVDSIVLRHEPNGSSIRICPRCHAITRSGAACRCSQSPADHRLPLVEKGTRTCETCGIPYRDNFEAPYYARYAPLVIVGQCPQHGLFFAQPTLADLACIERADAGRAGLHFGPPEDFTISHHAYSFPYTALENTTRSILKKCQALFKACSTRAFAGLASGPCSRRSGSSKMALREPSRCVVRLMSALRSVTLPACVQGLDVSCSSRARPPR